LDSGAEKAIISSAYLDLFIVQNNKVLTKLFMFFKNIVCVEGGGKSLEGDHIKNYRLRLDSASSYGEIWEVVKDTVAFSLNQRRVGMMLFLDDLPIQLGAYHPIGTNNIILNRILV